MSSNNVKEYSNIKKEFNDQQNELKQQIDHISLRQLDIQNHIMTIEYANQNLMTMIQNEKDNSQKGKYYSGVKSNISLLTELHSVYKDYESVKCQYYKNITDLTYKKNHLVEVEIRRLDEKVEKFGSNEMAAVFDKMGELFKSEKMNSIPINFGDEEYSL